MPKSPSKPQPVDLFGDTITSRDPAPPKPRKRPPEKIAAESPAPAFSHLAEIAVESPVRGTFTYIADEFAARLVPGTRVLVPFGRRPTPGFFISERTSADLSGDGVDPSKLKPILRILDDDAAAISPALLELARWMSRHYICPLGQVLASMLPAGVKRGMDSARVRFVETDLSIDELLKHAESFKEKRPKQSALLYSLSLHLSEYADRRPISASGLLQDADAPGSALKALEMAGLLCIVSKTHAELAASVSLQARSENLSLNDEQQRAYDAIDIALRGGSPSGFLLHGITGSGKTEVYLRALQTALDLGRQAIVLVPEIALTPQTAERFESRLGRERVAVLHSHITDGDRAVAWRAVRAGKIDVVVGARSALFAPLPRLGVIVIDEEHENAFKQESAPRYHARDTALELSRITKSVVILGSATPSLESLHAAKQGTLTHLSLSKRATGQPLPPVTIVDMTQENREVQRYAYLSRLLVSELTAVLARGEQAILFMNRRGFATVITCLHCGNTEKCEHCDIALTSHRKSNALVCHYCNFTKPIPDLCAVCGAPNLKHWGLGTERVEQAVKAEFPTARVARMDSDTMTQRSAYIETLGAFRARKTDILIGTQMIAKGLDFPSVTLVGVVLADTSLHMPDFRGRERTYQLISQVSGRAGRSEKGGRVIVQTHLPNDPAIVAAANHETENFVLEELRERRAFSYPPFSRLARIVLRAKEPAPLSSGARTLGEALKNRVAGDASLKGAQILGPTDAPIAKIEDYFRKHILIKAASSDQLSLLIDGPIADSLQKLPGVEGIIDVDAVSMM